MCVCLCVYVVYVYDDTSSINTYKKCTLINKYI